jgi:hypothetical protein
MRTLQVISPRRNALPQTLGEHHRQLWLPKTPSELPPGRDRVGLGLISALPQINSSQLKLKSCVRARRPFVVGRGGAEALTAMCGG